MHGSTNKLHGNCCTVVDHVTNIRLADSGYRCANCPTITKNGLPPHRLLARHETINRRFKKFAILGGRHKEDKHEDVFRCISVLVQSDNVRGHNIFHVFLAHEAFILGMLKRMKMWLNFKYDSKTRKYSRHTCVDFIFIRYIPCKFFTYNTKFI